MTQRTPRRRISPRTKLKLRAIKNFFRRKLGTTSLEYTNNSDSNIDVSVTELKSKIDILEQQLHRVSKHCQELANLEKAFGNQPAYLTKDILQRRDSYEIEAAHSPIQSKSDLKKVETKLLYRNSSKQIIDCKKSSNAIKKTKHEYENDMTSPKPTYSKKLNDGQSKRKNYNFKSHEYDKNYNERTMLTKKYNKSFHTYSTSSFRSLAVPSVKKDAIDYSSHRKKKYRQRDSYVDKNISKTSLILPDHDRSYKKHASFRRDRSEYKQVDEDFIADIIKRQYKPVKLFGKRHSDFSQFSAPVCRDYEYNIRKEIHEGSELCSCCFNENRKHKHRYVRNSDVSDMRSICDTRLYSSKRQRSRSRKYMDDYNNERLYDIVPVKEKSSPKSRKKFAEDSMISYQCKEVPPSPRTHRPKLNLKVHNYSAYEDRKKNRKHLNLIDSEIRENVERNFNRYQSDLSIQSNTNKRINENLLNVTTTNKSAQIHEQNETMNYDQSNVFKDTTLTTHTTDLTTDKTDKTLVEIKDILQSFLVEMKKESHDGQSNSTNRNEHKNVNEQQQDTMKSSKEPNGHNFNYNMGQCAPPFLPTFPNPCCYPVIPMNMCPMNCLHNGYIIPNPSLTCTACPKHSKENTCIGKDCCNNKSKSSHEINTNNETQELIKEIYKFVSQNPNLENKCDRKSVNRHKNEKKILTNRSVGGSNKAFRHDANVGTPNMRCYSKSCEAFGSRMQSDSNYTTNASYSDTVLEKICLEATQSSTETDVSSDTPVVKDKQSKFKKVMQSLRLLKKKKDVIEEVSEDRSLDNVPKLRTPFPQNITNYVMHGREYFCAPPVPKQHQHFCPTRSPTHSYDHQTHLPTHEFCNHQGHYCSPVNPTHYNPKNYSPGPFCTNYDPLCNQIQTPQVPLCLKEIEVKSIGTQSVRKMSIFRKFTKKMQPEIQNDASQQYTSQVPINKPTLWKSLQEKAKQQNTDPVAFSLKTQKQLTQGDMKLRNVMLKKLFYKRNPFSPRNLIVRTLLGKDKSSFGNPPKMYKPRMFL